MALDLYVRHVNQHLASVHNFPDKTELIRIKDIHWLKRNIFRNKCSPSILFQCEVKINIDPQSILYSLKRTMTEAEFFHRSKSFYVPEELRKPSLLHTFVGMLLLFAAVCLDAGITLLSDKPFSHVSFLIDS